MAAPMGKTTQKEAKPAPPPPRRASRLPADGRLMAEGLRKMTPPGKYAINLTPNPTGERFISTAYRVSARIKSGSLHEHNPFTPLAPGGGNGDGDRYYAEVGNEEAGEDEGDAAAPGGADVAEAEGNND